MYDSPDTVPMFAPNLSNSNSNSNPRILRKSMDHPQQWVLFEESIKNIQSLFFTWTAAAISACVHIWSVGIAVTQFSQKFKIYKRFI